ncbi:MAG TPA: nuclear transport factor 2 family protein [Steroidobacteraceae bacterium]|nr:nuclear transport factor 2 family protein [Steroidobacteraceae bacterium]
MMRAHPGAMALATLIGCFAGPSLLAAATPPQSLEARIQRIDDRMAIQQLLMEYGRAVDNRDFAAFAALFTEDGEWQGAQGSYRGRKEIQESMEKMFTDAAADIPQGKNFHLLTNVIIDLQGDHATASSKFIFYKMNGAKPEAEVAGRYEDQLVRVGGAWKFKQRRALPPG